MKLVTKQLLAEEAASRWQRGYMRIRNGTQVWDKIGVNCDVDSKDIYDRLIAIKNVTPELVDQVIGNNSWTIIYCDHCGRTDVDKAVELDVTGGEYTTHLCEECLSSAFELISKAGSTG